MARTSLVRGAAAGGVLFLALAAGTGIASAAPYGGTSTSGVTTAGGGAATFNGNGFDPGSPVTVAVTSCGTTSSFSGTAGSDGSVSIPTTGAGQTSFTATGTDGDGLPLTETSSAVLDATCPATAAGGGGGTGGGGGLPFTGFEVGAASALGVGAIGAGVIVIFASRRRRRDQAAV